MRSALTASVRLRLFSTIPPEIPCVPSVVLSLNPTPSMRPPSGGLLPMSLGITTRFVLVDPQILFWLMVDFPRWLRSLMVPLGSSCPRRWVGGRIVAPIQIEGWFLLSRPLLLCLIGKGVWCFGCCWGRLEFVGFLFIELHLDFLS